MQETGLVWRLNGPSAEVKVKVDLKCGRCNLCQPDEDGRGLVQVLNPLGARPGDKVRIELSSGRFVVAAGLIFILPLLGLIVGLGVGQFLSHKYNMAEGTGHLISLSSGVGLLGLVFATVHFLDKHLGRRPGWPGRIVEIIQDPGKK